MTIVESNKTRAATVVDGKFQSHINMSYSRSEFHGSSSELLAKPATGRPLNVTCVWKLTLLPISSLSLRFKCFDEWMAEYQ